MSIPELLAPAGTPESLDAAVAEGADAVYLGLKNFNARMRSANFTYSQFENALRVLHRMGRKLYVTVNTVFEDREADRMYQLLKYLAGLGPDGIVVQDFGVITMVRENFPSLKLCASTQMNIASARGVNLLSRCGFSRVVLARELSLDEIREIRGLTNMELEVFIHGALCMSVSGICLFSSYLGGKSANRGMCAQACRRFYYPDENAGSAKSAMYADSGNGAYYFSPCDLQLLEQIPLLAEAGINSFKIEGRMKSAEYVGAVVSAYRLVLDNLEQSGSAANGGLEKALKQAREILCNDFARPKSTYLFNAGSEPDAKTPAFDWLNPQQNGGTGIPLGKILKIRGNEQPFGLLAAGPVLPAAGDTIRLHSRDDSRRESHKVLSVEDDAAGRWVTIPDNFSINDAVYLIQTKAMTKHYPKIINKNIESSGRSPGMDRAPLPQNFIKSGESAREKKQPDELKEGFYVQVAGTEDLFAVQSVRPVKAILSYNHYLLSKLVNNKQPLPFNKDEIILSLDPFFPQNDDKVLADDLSVLLEKGFRFFILNNPGHFSFFKKANEDDKLTLIAGPWLYVYNRWSLSFLNSNGYSYFISPPENNRQNLERTLDGKFSGTKPAAKHQETRGRPVNVNRRNAFITIYSKPSLFRIRSDLGKYYEFGKFADSQGEMFRLASSSNGSVVYPEIPFYIGDKVPFLREAGFRRFIIDLSSEPVKKSGYRELMKAVNEFVFPGGMSRFNWKDGFYKDPSS